MTTQELEASFKQRVSAQVTLRSEGVRRYRVLTPFRFDDGDHLSILLKHTDAGWVLSDEGHTFLHLSYELEDGDMLRGNRQRIIANALSAFEVIDADGEMLKVVPGDRFGDALYDYVQALLRISDVTFLSRERVRSMFSEDLRDFLAEQVPDKHCHGPWHDPVRDREGQYPADYAINGVGRPLVVFGLPNDDRTRDATISLLKYETWGSPPRSLAIFEDQERISRKVLARLTDVVDRQFSSLAAHNRDRIGEYLRKALDSA